MEEDKKPTQPVMKEYDGKPVVRIPEPPPFDSKGLRMEMWR
jgi:predicted RNase H-like nuclease